MKNKILITTAASILAITMIAGCSAGTKAGSVREDRFEAAETAPAMYSANKTNNFVSGVDLDFAGSVAADEEFVSEGANTPGSPDILNDVNVDPSQGRLLIRTVSITAETTKYASVASELENQVKLLGGYIEYSSMRGTGNNKDLRTGSYTVRVPADKLDSLIDTVGGNCTITASNENTSDVTLEYVDTKARIESLRVEYEQLLELLDNAEDLDTIIILQSRITDVRYDIESNESRIRVLENQVQYATLSLTLQEVLEEKEVEEAHVVTYGEKVVDQFKDMWENTVEFFQNLLLGIIACIPGLVFIAVNVVVILIIVFTARKKRRARRAKALAEKEAAAKAEEAKAENKEEKNEVKNEQKEEGKE